MPREKESASAGAARATRPNRSRLAWTAGALALAFAAALYLWNGRPVPDGSARYVVTVADEAPERLEVEASFTLHDPLLFTTHEGPDPGAYAPFVRDLRVVDASGRALEVTPCEPRQILRCELWKGWERGHKWRVAARPGTPVTVAYHVALEHDPAAWPAGLDSAAYAVERGVYSTGRALFVMNGRIRSPFISTNLAWMEGWLVPREDGREGIAVAFDLPAGWRASTPWPEADPGTEPGAEPGAATFVADDLVALSESMLVLGDHEQQRLRSGGTTVTLALVGATATGAAEELQSAFVEITDYFTGVLGGPPRTTRENPIERTIVVVTSGPALEGEVIGNDVSITLVEGRDVFEIHGADATGGEPASLPLKVAFHEFFHLWNGMTFSTAPDAEWFKEGVTDYYALRAARRLGYLDREGFFVLLGDQVRRYRAARAASELSLAAAGEDEFGNHELIYPGGLLVGLCLDLTLRAETADARGLDDLMARVYREFGASGRAVATADVRAIAEDLADADLGLFFERYIRGTETVPLAACLGLAGLTVAGDAATFTVEVVDAPPPAEAIRSSVF